MTIDLKTSGIAARDWYFLTISSVGGTHEMQLWDKSWASKETATKTSGGPISLGSASLFIGLSSDSVSGASRGFTGSIKHVTLFGEAISSEGGLKNIASQYLYPIANPSMLLELPLDDIEPYSGLFEQVNKFNAEVFAHGSGWTSGGLTQVPDESPNWNCFCQDPADFDQLLRFQGSSTYFDKISLQNYLDTNDEQGSYQTTVSMWIYREHLSSTKGEVYMQSDGSIGGRPENWLMPNGGGDEVLFDHEGIVTLTFFEDSSDYLTVYNFDDSSRARSIDVEVPRGQWIWI